MTTDPAAPADTTMMRIVHDALRRDLVRARAALTDPLVADRRRAAVTDHVVWMMAFLDAHHRSEDEGLYPLLRERDPEAATVLDAMDRDHHDIAEAIDRVVAAASTVHDDDGTAVVAALDELSARLLPHLRREEDEAMPLVSRSITRGEWDDIEQEHNLAGKSMAQLAREGHWLIDDADDEDRAVVLGLVPPVPRFVLRYGFGPSYRRYARRCWGSRRRIDHEGDVAVVVEAAIDDVWEVVRDPTRVGEWSHECTGGEWIGDATGATPGAQFRGRNRQGLFRWGRRCEVVRVDPYELVWRTIPTTLYPDSTEWSLHLEAVPGGTRIEQRFRVVKGTWLEPVYATVLPAHRDRADALRADLERIGTVALEHGPTTARLAS